MQTIEVKLFSDNTPGLVRRYVLQQVKYSPVLPICVNIDGICNHADTDTQMVAASYEPSEEVSAEVCTKCNEVIGS